MNRLERFNAIKAHYDARDRDGLRHGKLPMHDTTHGFWGTSNMNDAYTLFTRIRLERFRFADLGCGDGRIALIAALFTSATGVEGDEALARLGQEAAETLGSTAVIKHGDYYEEDLSRYDLLFMFPDKRYDDRMVAKLRAEFTGTLLVYNRIHDPPGIKAGKTYWLDQLPVKSYAFNKEDEDLAA